MESLRKFVAPEIVFGAGALTLAGRYARNLGASKVFLVWMEHRLGKGKKVR